LKSRAYVVGGEQFGHISSDLHPGTEALARSWLETSDKPLAIVDQHLRLYWVNPPGERHLLARIAFETRDATFACIDSAYRSELEHFVSSANQIASTWSLPWADGHVLMRAIEIHRNHLHRYLGLQFFFTNTFESVYSDIDRAFCLTSQEYRIVRLLLKSKRPEQIASELDLRLPTVRTHVRNIYSKLNVKNSAELFHCLAPFRLV
jgi:DNA-binding CsgD family transcriptional regulator